MYIVPINENSKSLFAGYTVAILGSVWIHTLSIKTFGAKKSQISIRRMQLVDERIKVQKVA